MDEDRIEADPPRQSRFRRFAPLLLVAGALASAFILIPNVPRERQVELRLEDTATITGVRVEWAVSSAPRRAQEATSATSEDPIHGASWHFSAGSAPTSVLTTVRLPNGPYDLDILIERGEQAHAVHRSLTLGDADQIAVTVR